jgi:magnesium transporter
VLKAVAFQQGRWSEVADPERISDIVSEDGTLVWAMIDARDMKPIDIEMISGELGLHPLAVEDALAQRQRPKVEPYERHLFAVMHELSDDGQTIVATQLSCFIGTRWVLTIHGGAHLDSVIPRLDAPVPGQGTSAILHALLDAIVDGYERIAEGLEAEVDELEARALGSTRPTLQDEVFAVKRRLVTLRRYVVPGERVLRALVGDLTAVPSETTARFRDVHDHLLRTLDVTRDVGEILDAIVNLQRADQNAEFGEVTKRLTGWAAIVAVPTFIASFYGMNFRLLPQEQTLTGFWTASGLMVVSGIALFVMFKRKRWI